MLLKVPEEGELWVGMRRVGGGFPGVGGAEPCSEWPEPQGRHTHTHVCGSVHTRVHSQEKRPTARWRLVKSGCV